MYFSSFTSESVSDGHPDKVADQISDAVLDLLLEQDPEARCACETLVKTGLVLLAGEIRTNAWADIEDLVRQVVKDIGYDNSAEGFDYASCGVINAIGKQSADIARGVDSSSQASNKKKLGAGDQGMMFGFATRETASLMPAPIHYAHRLMQQQRRLRQKRNFLRPDAKAQLSFTYDNNRPVAINAVVLSTQHTPDISYKKLKECVMEEIIKPVLPAKWLGRHTRYHINPTGRFVTGGPTGDCGLTGRKIIVDTYGGFARHGGGAFSGKDPTKVDRSAAYAARYLAKNVVAAKLASVCEIQVSYAIGVAEPTSLSVNTHGSGKIPDKEISALLTRHFDLTPEGIIQALDLARPIYRQTAAFGHFGRSNFPWEKTDHARLLATGK